MTPKEIAEAAAAEQLPPGPKIGLDVLDFEITQVERFSGLPDDIYDITSNRPPQLRIATEGRHVQPSISRPAEYLNRSGKTDVPPLVPFDVGLFIFFQRPVRTMTPDSSATACVFVDFVSFPQ